MKKSILLGAAAALVVAGGAGAFALSDRNAPESSAYFSEVVRVGDIEQSVAASGEVLPREVVDVGVEVSGQVTQLLVRPGDTVTQGQVLGRIDPMLLQNSLRNAENQLNRELNGQRNAETRLANARRNLVRQQTLRDQGFGAQVAYESVLAQVAAAENDVQQNVADIRAAELNVQARQADLDKTVIRAPISGVVAEVVVPQGAMVSTWRDTPVVLRIAKLDTMTVKAPISESDIIKVREGQKVYFTTIGDPERRHEATLRAVEMVPATGGLEPSADVATRPAVYYNALFDVENAQGALLPAMTADVRIVLGEAEEVPLMPAVALGPRGTDGRYSVQVVDSDGDLVQRSVSIGLTDGVAAQVTGGLNVGDRVVTGQAVGVMEG